MMFDRPGTGGPAFCRPFTSGAKYGILHPRVADTAQDIKE